jgi:hypothetical protein
MNLLSDPNDICFQQRPPDKSQGEPEEVTLNLTRKWRVSLLGHMLHSGNAGTWKTMVATTSWNAVCEARAPHELQHLPWVQLLRAVEYEQFRSQPNMRCILSCVFVTPNCLLLAPPRCNTRPSDKLCNYSSNTEVIARGEGSTWGFFFFGNLVLKK